MKNFTLFLLLTAFPAFSQLTQFNADIPTGSFARSLDVYQNEVVVGQGTAAGLNICLFYVSSIVMAHTATLNVNNDTGQLNNYGVSLSMANNFIAVGIPRNDTNAADAGVVRIYRKNSGTYSFIQQISAPDFAGGDLFGSFVKLHNNVLYVSAIDEEAENLPSDTNSGAVYTYTFDGNQWNFAQKITETPEGGMYEFGRKIVTENDQVVISSLTSQFGYSNYHQYTDNAGVLGNGNFMGTFGNLEDVVRDFDFQDGKLYLVVNGIEGGGGTSNKVEIYTNPGTGYELSDIVYQPNNDGYIYGYIEVAGDKMFIGNIGWLLADTSRYPLNYFKYINGTWTYQTQFFSEQSTINFDDRFGTVMANYGNNLIVGAPGEFEVGNLHSGQAYYLDTTLLPTQSFAKDSPILYPNPTNDKVYFENATIENAKVYSITGNLLLTVDGSLTELSLQDFSSGIYFIKANTKDGESHTFKIIKN